MRQVLVALVAVSAVAIPPVSSEEIESRTSLASLDLIADTSRAVAAFDSEQIRALIKEGDSETPETIARIEKNREDRERTVVMDR